MEPPDPIPNSVVKHGSADDTAVSGRGKVGRRLIFFASSFLYRTLVEARIYSANYELYLLDVACATPPSYAS